MKQLSTGGLPRRPHGHKRATRGQGNVPVEHVLAAARALFDADQVVTQGTIALALGGIPTNRLQEHGDALATLARSWLDGLIAEPVENDNTARRAWIGKALRNRRVWSEANGGYATDEQRDAVGAKYVRLGCDILLSEHLTGYDLPSGADYMREIGYWPKPGPSMAFYRETLQDHLKELGVSPYPNITYGSPEYDSFSLSDALERVDPALHFIPFTYLDDPNKYQHPSKKLLVRSINFQSKCIRQWAFLLAMICPDTSSTFRTDMFSKLCRMVASLGYDRNADLGAFDFQKHFSDYMAGKLKGFESDERSTIYNVVSSYFGALNIQEEWYRRMLPEQQDRFKPFLLPKPKDDYFFKAGYYQSEVREEQRRVRKDRVAPVADRFYQLRFIVDIRFSELKRLRQGVYDGIAKVEEGGETAPYSYSYPETTFDVDGRETKVTRHFVLWTRAAVEEERIRRAADQDEEGLSRYGVGRIARRKAEPADRRRNEKYLLQYVRTENDKGEAVDDYWFMDLLRVGALKGAPDEAARAWLREQGYPEDAAFSCATGALSHRVANAAFASIAQEVLNINFVPYEELYTGAMFGRAIMRLGTTTGARIGEIGQIFPGKKCIISVEMPSGKKATAFTAIPKGLKELRSFYMDDVSLSCLLDIAQRHKELEVEGYGGLRAVKAPVHLANKCGHAKYLFQLNGRPLHTNDMNSCLRFVLHGLEFRDSTGNTFSVSSHFLRHAYATEMKNQGVDIDILAALMNQKWVEVTKYYAKPTPARVREAAEQSFVTQFAFKTKCGIREPDEIFQMLADAEGKVGALTNVLGGTCTESGFCKAKFQCIGCAANAPDPGQREAVELKRRHALEWLKIAQKNNMTGELNATRTILSSCDDMLKEMDLLVTAAVNSEQVVSITSSKRFGANH